jgi:hypothetical protein
MPKVVVYKATGGEYAVVDVPDSYQKGDRKPEPGQADRYYSEKVEAFADARSRHGGNVFVIDESNSPL